MSRSMPLSVAQRGPVALVVAAAAVAAVAPMAVHNPHNVTVTEIHLVFSNHFDGGCKTPRCGDLRPGEPSLCAKVQFRWDNNPNGTGEPFDYHIVNRYFDTFIPRALRLVREAKGTGNPYRYMLPVE